MAIIKLTLPAPINASLQAKPSTVADGLEVDTGAWDVIYFIRIDAKGKQVGDIYKLGDCISVAPGSTDYVIEVDVDATTQTPTIGDYIFFGKNNKIGTSGVKGYHSVIEMKNDSQDKAELFAVSSEINISSK